VGASSGRIAHIATRVAAVFSKPQGTSAFRQAACDWLFFRKVAEEVKPDEHPRFGDIVASAFTPVLAKHSKSFSLIDCISVGVDRMQRNFEPMRKQVEAWQRSELTDVTAKVVIYEAFVEGRLEAPKHLARTGYDLYFEPKYEEFRPRTIWSLSNAFTSAFKELEPIPQFKATAKLGEFLEARFSQSL
jgi:hypothetical protein